MAKNVECGVFSLNISSEMMIHGILPLNLKGVNSKYIYVAITQPLCIYGRRKFVVCSALSPIIIYIASLCCWLYYFKDEEALLFHTCHSI